MPDPYKTLSIDIVYRLIDGAVSKKKKKKRKIRPQAINNTIDANKITTKHSVKKIYIFALRAVDLFPTKCHCSLVAN